MSKVFAVAREVPSSAPYLTAGKLYPVEPELGDAFMVTPNSDLMFHGTWKSCAHLDGRDWTRVEIDREQAAAIVTALGGKVERPDPEQEAFDEARVAWTDMLEARDLHAWAEQVRVGNIGDDDKAAIRWLMAYNARIREEARNG